MTEQTAPSAPPLLPPSSSADGGGSSHRLRRSSTTNSDNYGPDNNNRRRNPPSSSAPGVQRQPSQPISDGERRRSRDSRRSNTATGSSRRQPPVELAMSFHSASDQPLPPPPPVSVRSSSSVRRSSSVGTNQSQSQSQSQSQAQAQKRKKKGASQTSAAVPAQAGAASTDERIMRASSRSNSRSRSSRPPSRSNSHIRESAATSTSTAAAAASELAASVAATQAELERRQSRLAEIRQRSDAEKYELTIQEEAKKIRRLQKKQRKQEEEMIRMQQQQQQRRQNQTLNVEAPLDFSAPTRPAVGTTAVAAVGRESGSSHSNTSIEDAIVRRDSSMSGAGTQSQKSNKRNTTGNLTGQQRRQSQQRHNSATIAAVPAVSANPSASVRSSVAADEALARKLQNDMLREQEAVRAMEQQFQDEEMARSLAAAEAARMTSLGLSPDDMIDGTDGGRGRSSRGGGGGCCNTMHKMVSFVIMAGCVGVVLFVLFGIVYRSAGGDPEALPPWFRDAWDDRSGWEGDYGQGANASDFQRWRIGRNKKGLKLTLINGLSDDWNDHFYQAIEDWNEAGALELATVLDNEGPPCEKHTRGMVKTCNGDYGRTDWTGLNELLFENGWIVSSVAMMNENYLRNARDVERQYVMCHELGHAWGLPHRDEIVGNRDLGTCLDYTITPQNNMKPDEIDFENLSQMYGEVTIGRGRRLKMTASAGGADMFVSSYTNTTHLAHGTKRSTTTRSTREGRSDRVLLHKSDSHEIWEEDLGNGRRLVTKVLLSTRRD